MPSFSILILTKNEEKNIARCLKPLLDLSDDVILLDNGSTDATKDIALALSAKVQLLQWEGYAMTKNKGHAFAKYDWILSLDADEEINEELKTEIKELFAKDIAVENAFLLRRKMVFGTQILHHGSLSNEYRLRLFNKNIAHWNNAEVHEDIRFDKPAQIHKLKGYIKHYSYDTTAAHRLKLEHYAQLSAQQMFAKAKPSSFIKRHISPLFGFIKNYIFRAGFLDGKLGYAYARNEMWYVSRKYTLLQELNAEC